MFSRRMLWQLLLPLILEQLLNVTIGMADTIMVSGVGDAAVSAVSLVDAINMLMIQLFASFATGGAVICSQYMGRKEPKNAGKAAKQLLYFSFAIACLLGALAVALHRQLLQLIIGSVEADVMGHARTYFIIAASSYPLFAVYNACAAFMRSMGKSRVTFYMSCIMNLINVGLNALLIYGFQMGVAGAAIATWVARFAGAVISLLLICRPEYPIHITRLFQYRPDMKMLGRILRIALPTGAENSLFQLGKLLISGLIATFGTLAISADAICGHLANFAFIPGQAIALGMVTVVGQCMGASKPKQASKYAGRLWLITEGIAIATAAVLFVFAPVFCGFFQLSAEAQQIAVGLLRFFCLFVPLFPPGCTLPNALRAAGDVRFTLPVALGSMFVCRVVLAYVLALCTPLGIYSVWIAMYADWVLKGIFFVARYLQGGWKKHKVI